MEQLIRFNGVMVLLTTGQSIGEVQSFLDRADVVISVYPKEDGGVKIIKEQHG